MLILPAAAGAALPFRVRLPLVLLAFPVAAISQRWIEEPIRHGRLAALRPGSTLAMAGILSLIVASVSAGSGVIGSVRLRGSVPFDLVPPLANARDDLPRIYKDGCHVPFKDTRSGLCTYGDLTSATTVVLFGDSHAAQWFPALEQLARQCHWRLLSLTKAACSAADAPSWNSELKRIYTECDAWRADALSRIRAVHPILVVISHSRRHAIALGDRPVPSEEHEDLWRQALDRTIKHLSPLADRVVIIGDTPRATKDVPVCLSSHRYDAQACATPLTEAINSTRTADELATAEANGATFIDPTPWLCPAKICPAVVGRMLIFRDSHHMTATYARALAPYLGARLPIRPQ